MRFAMTCLSAALLCAGCGGGDDGGDTVEVFKSLGSMQCTGGGSTPEALRGQLSGAGVAVVATSCGSDGLAYPAMCGAPDGAIAIFEVPASQLQAAQSLSFAPLSSAPAARKSACR